jgi:hypothetical protein
VSPLYAGLDFAKATNWHLFLGSYLRAMKSR